GVEEQRVNIIVDFADPAAAAQVLGDGYRVEVRVIESQVDDVLTVPVGSLFRRGEEWAVFVVDDEGRARTQPVTLGRRNATVAESTAGLQEGQRLLLHSRDTLAAGLRVVQRST